MGKFSDWLNGTKTQSESEKNYEFYEDTHNEKGEYVGKTRTVTPAIPLPDKSQFIAPRNYQNVVVYEPKTPEDVQRLIDYLKRREPAVINLDNTDEDISQRILDFISGAIYALSGSVHRIAGNIFLLSPEGVEITVPYEI